MRTSWGSATDRGAVRSVNEDAALTYPPVFLVADGMGGHDAGDLASRIAVEEFAHLAGQHRATVDDVRACARRTSDRIRAEFTRGRQGGTTVAGVALVTTDEGPRWLVFNLGDSRVYRSNGGPLEQLSTDHSVVQGMVERGVLSRQEASRHPDRHVLTRALGTQGDPDPDCRTFTAARGDRMLVCTDGLTRELDDEEIAAALVGRPDPQDAAVGLVAEAVRRGARDNVTVVVVDLQGSPPTFDDAHSTAPRTTRGRTRGWDEMLDGATMPRRL